MEQILNIALAIGFTLLIGAGLYLAFKNGWDEKIF